MSNPFDYINDILTTKKNLIVDSTTEKDYNSFIINRGLSYYKDCIMQVNEMNRRHSIDNKMKNDFLINSIRSYKRPYVKWTKSEKNLDVECIKVAFNLSDKKALEVFDLFSKEQIKHLKDKADIGGVKK